MKTRRLTQEHYNLLKEGGPSCPPDMTFTVGKEYVIKNPSNPGEQLIARCTQNCPYALIKVSNL